MTSTSATGTISPTAGTEPSCGTVEAASVENLSFGYGDELVTRKVSFSVPRGAFVSLLGPSGCGKTTLLKLLGGYLKPSSGTIRMQDRDVTLTPPELRDAGMVFQNYALFPHLSAWKNVAFGLEARGFSREITRERVDATLDRVGLDAPLRGRLPGRLSGGQQQRVALARALAFGPRLLLLDEPLASLDRRLRENLREELRRLHREANVATVMVTHDQEEALALSDWIGVLRKGVLLQFDAPRTVYERPRTPFVARFLGDANILEGRLVGRPAGTLAMIRPENVRLGGDREGVIRRVSFQGADILAEIQSGDSNLRIRARASAGLTPGERVNFDFPREHVWILPESDDFE